MKKSIVFAMLLVPCMAVAENSEPKLTIGMTQKQVIEAIGAPDELYVEAFRAKMQYGDCMLTIERIGAESLVGYSYQCKTLFQGFSDEPIAEPVEEPDNKVVDSTCTDACFQGFVDNLRPCMSAPPSNPGSALIYANCLEKATNTSDQCNADCGVETK